MEQFNKHQFKEIDQQLFTDSFNVCWELLKKKEYYVSERETNIFSRLSLNYGQDMYDAMMIIMNNIMKSNKDKNAVEKSKVESIKSVTAEATCHSGYDDNSDQIDQQQQQQKQQVDKVHSQDKIISKKRKISVDKVHSKKIFKEDNNKNNCDDSSNSRNIQIVSSNENSIEKLHMIDFIKKEEEFYTEESITIKDEPTPDDLIDVDKINNFYEHSMGRVIKSNEISNLVNGDNQSCSNKVIENGDHQKNTRISTGLLARKKYSVYTEEDDELSSTADENHLDAGDDDYDDDDNDDNNNLNQNKSLEDKIKVTDDISFKERARVIKLALENPTWSLSMLREQSGCKNIRDHHQVGVWKKQIEQGGSPREKNNFVNDWVINKCIENQKKGEIITNKKIRTWALEAKKICKPMKFSASDGWLRFLKKNHEITGKPNNLKINCNLQKKKSFSYSRVFVPHSIKVKIVNLANENRHWSLEMLRKQSGCNNLENIWQLNNWKQDVRNFNKKRAANLSTEKN